MTTTDPTTRPIHERWSFGVSGDTLTSLLLDDEYVAALRKSEKPAIDALIDAAGKTHAVLVNLPDAAGGGQIVTWSYPNGAVEAAWRATSSTSDRWQPVDQLGGSVVVAP